MTRQTPLTCAILTALAFAATPAARARLGETVEQCDKRYGTPLKVGRNKLGYEGRLYEKDGFRIRAWFKDDKDVAMVYYKPKTDSKTNANVKLNALEIDKLLAVNSDKIRWLMLDPSSLYSMRWKRRDAKAVAMYDPIDNELIIASETEDKKAEEMADYYDADQMFDIEKKKAGPEGFLDGF